MRPDSTFLLRGRRPESKVSTSSRPEPPRSIRQENVLPTPPDNLAFDQVTLRFARLLPGDPDLGLVPAYHFRILLAEHLDAGHLNFRVGDTPHVLNCAGHIGFSVHESLRGHHYAWQA